MVSSISVLKDILVNNKCSFDKYLMKLPYIKTKDDIKELIYITPVVTLKKKRFLIITKEIKGNWFENTKNLDDILRYLADTHGYHTKDHNFIFHIFIENIKFEHFYLVDLNSDKMLIKTTIENLNRVLSS